MGLKPKYKDGGFPDNRERLFARGSDLVYLMGRADTKGITAITGRPKLGKTWLLHELCRSLSEANGHLVGYTRSTGQSSDLLLRSVANLYARWLAKSSFSEQARIVWKQQKKGLITHFGKFTGKAIEGVLKLARPELSAFAKAIEGVFGGLGAADRELKTGGLQMPRLNYDDAHALVSVLAAITDRPITLLLDAWEQSPDVDQESKLLHAILDRLEDWPNLHIFIALRADDPAHELVRDLDRSSPLMDIHKLRALNLREDEKEQRRMITYIRAHVTAVEAATDEELLKMIQGYPGVIDRWLEPQRQNALKTMADLKREANDAQTYRYREFDIDMPKVSQEAQCFALCLTLIPQISDHNQWDALKPILLNSLHEHPVFELHEYGILDNSESYPTFGHATRHEAAVRWIESNSSLMQQQREAERLIVSAASKIIDESSEASTYAIILAAIGATALKLSLPDKLLAQCIAAVTMLLDKLLNEIYILPLLNSGLDAAREYKGSRNLISMGMINLLISAEKNNDRVLQAKFLDKLRILASEYPENKIVRTSLAMGLFNTLVHLDEDYYLTSGNELIKELRLLAEKNPEDHATRDRLATSLLYSLFKSSEAGEALRHNEIFDELRNLAYINKEDREVCEPFAIGLHLMITDFNEEDDLAQCYELLDELQILASIHKDDHVIQRPLAMSFLYTLCLMKAVNDLKRHDELLEKFRLLAAVWPEEAVIQESWQNTLTFLLHDAEDENDADLAEALRGEIRDLGFESEME